MLAAGSAGAALASENLSDTSLAMKATYLVSDSSITPDKEIGWKGLLTGLKGFEHFYNPVGSPIYFENPFNSTEVRLLYLHHEFASKSQLAGGHLDVFAAQIRLAITERLGFIATKDGYSQLRANALPRDEGWNDLAFGFKYVFWVDRENDFVVTGGFRYQAGNGSGKVLQGGCQEVSPFITFAKGWDKFHLIADVSDRIPLDNDKGNNVVQWDIHADYEIYKGIAPMLELHGLHYCSNGTRTPLSVGGLDYTNLGSTDVAGSTVIWAGLGARFKLSPNFSLGATYEMNLGNRKADIMDKRVTVDFVFTW
jgi:hypothetical protein